MRSGLIKSLFTFPLLLLSLMCLAQFNFSDNATNYGANWINGSNGGTGFNGWLISSGGPSAGTFIGNPASDGMGTTGIGTTAFGLFGHSGVFVNAVRYFGEGGTNVSMQVGDVFSFYWVMNWDAGGGSKGFDLRAGGTTIFNVNNSGSQDIATTNGTADFGFGTTPMLVTLTRTSWTEYSFSMTRRSDGTTFSTTISSSANIDNINIYVGAQPDDDDGERNIYFNNFSFVKANNPYEIQSNLSEPRTLTGTSTLTKTGTDDLTLLRNNTYTGVTTVMAGTLILEGNMSSSEIIVNSGATLNIAGNVTINNLTINAGGTVQQNGFTLTVNGDLNSAGTYDFNGGGSPLIVNGNINILDGTFTLGPLPGGDLRVAGDFIKTGGTFNCNDRQIEFNGTGDQLYQSNETEEIDFFLNSNTSGTLTIQSDATASDLGDTWIFGASSSSVIPAGVTITHGNNAEFRANNGGATVQVFGTLSNSGERGADYNTTAPVLIMESGSTYEHNVTRSGLSSMGRLPFASWATGSNCLINGLTNPAAGSDFLGSSEEQSFGNFEWNCPSQTSNVNISGSTITAESFIMTSTGSGGVALGGGTDGLIDCMDYTHSGGRINFATGSGNGAINCSGNYSHTGGELLKSGSGTGTVNFDGSSNQSITSAGGTISDEVNLRVDNPVGITIENGSTLVINDNAFFYRTQGSVSVAGSGNIQYHPTGGRLSYDGNSPIITGNSEFPTTNGPAFLQIDNSAGVSLHANRSLTGGIFLDDGLLNLGANNLLLESGATIGGTPSVSSHINTDGTGELVRAYASSESGNYLYPIGQNGYSPADLEINNGTVARNIGFRVVDADHPQLNNPTPQTNFISRYWVVSNSAAGSYTYEIEVEYPAIDINGTESLIKLNRWDGSDWSHIGSTAGSNALIMTSLLSETDEPISGTYELTGRVKPAEINENADFDEFTTIEPTPSAEQSFNISATALTDDIVITVPTEFGVSLTSGGPFTNSVTITPTGGNLSSTPIYVQLDGTTAGAYSGNLTIASTGLTTISIPLIGTVLSPNTVIIDFDNTGNWIGSGFSSYSTAYVYSDQNWEFTGGPALRQTTSNQDGIPGAFGTYAWRLQDNSSVVWTATYNFDGTANSFGFKVRRWDDFPSANFIVEYSTDGGSNWSTALNPINNAFLNNSSKWKTFNFDLSSAATVGVGELIVRVSALGTTEIIMIDDFSFDITPSVCADPNVFFRSKNSGNWTNRGTWETSTTGSDPWSNAECAPDTDAQEILIRNGHTVTVSTDIDFDELVIESGGTLLHTAGIIDINDDAGADFTIENGGVYELDGGTAPNFSSSALLQVQTGGTIRVSQNQADLSGDLAGTQSSGDVEYQNGSIFEWNNNLSFLTANQTYFPDVPAGVVPIFRVTLEPGNVGAGSTTTINGLFEANANVNWQNTGTKVFRNGITGTGNVTQSLTGPCGSFQITGDAVIGGSGELSLNNNDLEIAGGASVILTSNKTINSIGATIPDITINGYLSDGGFAISGDYNSVTLGATGDIDVFNENGMSAIGGTFTNTASITCAIGSLVRYRRIGDQTISGINYEDLIVQGSGLKSCEGAVSARGFILDEDVSLGSEIGASLIVDQNFIVQSPATFDQTAYDRLVISMLSNINASINSWTDVRCFNLLQNTSNDISLIGGFSQLEIKNLWNCDMSSGSGVFTDNGKDILVGGDVFLRGGASNFNLTGSLRFTGEQPTQSLEGSTANAEIFAEINELRVEGLTGTPLVDIPTDIGLTVKTDVTIVDGTLSMGQGILNLGGNWTNYDQSGFNEGISRILFNGTGFQDITCPGGEVFSSLTLTNTNPSAGLRLNDDLSITGIASDVLDLFGGSVIDIQDHSLFINGPNGSPNTDIRVNDGICQIITSNPTLNSRVLIQNGTKTVESVAGGILEFGTALTVRLESGFDCGAPDLTLVNGIFEIADGGFVSVNPPVYAPVTSRLRYVASSTEASPYIKGQEWNSTSGQGYPNHVEVRGTYLDMNISSTHQTGGDLQIIDGGTLDIGTNGVNGNLIVKGNVDIGPSTPGNLVLGNNFGGDLFVEGSFRLFSGSFNPNDREVVMIGGNPSGSSIIGPVIFDFLAIDFPAGVVDVFQNITINDRLRLADGVLDVGTSVNVIMADNAKVLRESGTATMSISPIATGLDQYDIEYSASMSTDNEFTSVSTSVDELFLNGTSGPVTLILSDSRTFNGDLRLNNAILDLNGNTLSSAESIPGSGAFDAQIIVDGTDTCRVTGPANSTYNATGDNSELPGFRTKQVLSLNNTKLLFEENVLVRIGSGGFDFGTGNPTKIDGILEIAGGGYAINNSCFYGNQSLLRFSNGFDYQVNAGDVTWDAGDIASNNPGIPYNVSASGDNSTELVLNSPRSLRNDLTITGSQFTLTTNSGTFEIGGDWNRSGITSAFNPNGQEVIFNGENPQTINTFDGILSEEFFKLTFANTGIKTLQEDVTVLDSLKIAANGNLDLNNQTIFLGGNWNNLAGETAITETGRVELIGSSTQTISSASGEEVFDELVVANTSPLTEGIVLNSDIRVSGDLDLISGIIHPNTIEELIISENATNSGGDYRTYVNGVVRKDGFNSTNAYRFPVGYFNLNGPGDTTSVWQPVEILPQSASSSLEFDVRYVHENQVPGTSYPSNPPNVEPILETASTCNYWDINRSGAAINAQLRLFWNDSTTCFDINNPLLLRVARYSGSIWEDRGAVANSSVSPYNEGYVQSDWVSSFSPFAIGTTNSTNILPITLLSFRAEAVDGLVRTQWVTASEINNDFFTVERSKDGQNWETVGTVDGAGDSNQELSYGFVDDAPYYGISYYRLRQTDFDGTSTVSDPRAVEILQGDGFGLDKVYRGQEGLNLVYRSNAPYLVVEIYDMLGKRVHGELLENYGNGFSTIYPDLARGAYVLRLSHGSEMDSEKFVY